MIVAALLWLVLAIVPGAAILRLVNARWGWWKSLAAAPTVGFGFIYVVGLMASRIRLPVVTMVMAVIAALVIAWIAVEATRRGVFLVPGRVRRRLRISAVTWVRSRSVTESISQLMVVGSVLFSSIAWYLTERGLDFPPGWDSMHHGFFIRQISNFQTLESSNVLASSATGGGDGTSFYPLVFNLVAAVIHTISGAPVSHVILAGIVAIGAVFTPVTVFALARLIEPSRPLIAGVAAVAVSFPLATYAIIGTGRDNAVLGLAVVLGTAVVLLSTSRSLLMTGIIAVLSIIGLTGLHTSELPVAVLVAGSVAIVRTVRSREVRAFARWLAWAIAATLIAIAALAALEPTLLSAVSTRSGAMASSLAHPPVSIRSALFNVASLGWDRASGQLPLLQILIIVGLILPIFVKKLRPFLSSTIYYVIFGLLMLGLFTDGLGPLTFLTSPWYEDLDRLAWTYPILGAIPAAVAMVTILEVLASVVPSLRSRNDRIRPGDRSRSLIGPMAISGISVLALLVLALPPTLATNLQLRTYSAPAGPASRAVFQYLQKHIAAHDVVMDDLRISGSLWMYNDYSVRPLFGNAPYLGSAPKSWKERLWLRSNLSKIDSDACVAVMLKKYHVGYVYYDDAKISDGQREITRATLERHSQFKPYYSVGSVAVYSVTLPARLQPCTKDVSRGITWN